MDVSPKTLREVEFREKMRGYHPEDVDQFLEQVAAGLEVLQDRLRQAVDRAQRAEAAAADVGGSDETLRKTLVLAQRTADMAVQEARDQSARLLAGAEAQAQAMRSEAEERARRNHEESLVHIRSDLARLEAVRQQAQAEVDLIRRWVEEHRTTLSKSLSEALGMLERANVTSPPPTSRPIDVPPAPRPTGAAPSYPPDSGEVEPHPTGPETVAWQPPEGRSDGDDEHSSQVRDTSADPTGSVGPPRHVEVPSHAETQSQADSPLRPDSPPRTDAGLRQETQGRTEPGPRRDPDATSGDLAGGGEPADRSDLSGGKETPGRTGSRSTSYEGSPRADQVRGPLGGSTAEPTRSGPDGSDRDGSDPDRTEPGRTGPGRGEVATRTDVGPDSSGAGPDEQALDDFFDDERFAEERRFGGRLRRRR